MNEIELRKCKSVIIVAADNFPDLESKINARIVPLDFNQLLDIKFQDSGDSVSALIIIEDEIAY